MRSIVITGASSGIGAALTRRAVAAGWKVLAVARRADRLEALARETGCTTLAADVILPASAQAIVDRAVAAFGGIDVVVNNAGTAHAGNLLDVSDAQVERQLQLHLAGPLRIARAALPYVERAHGGFVFFGSGLARVPAPGYGAYASAKAAARAAAIQLRRELKPRGIFVTYVDPGVVDTEFSRASGMEERPAFWHGQPDAVAAAILRGIDRRAMRVNAIPWQTAMTVFGEWFPSIADHMIGGFVTPPAQNIDALPSTAVASAPYARDDNSDFRSALEPLQRRMERVKLPESFVRSLLVPNATIDLNDAAMRWAGMPNKNERAALHEVLDALAHAQFLRSESDEQWSVLRGADDTGP
jgi:3-oxoacyl-[acyl-carrier protein] reductase